MEGEYVHSVHLKMQHFYLHIFFGFKVFMVKIIKMDLFCLLTMITSAAFYRYAWKPDVIFGRKKVKT